MDVRLKVRQGTSYNPMMAVFREGDGGWGRKEEDYVEAVHEIF